MTVKVKEGKKKVSRRAFVKVMSSGLVGIPSIIGCSKLFKKEQLFVNRELTEPNGFKGAEGPACDIHGNLFAVNYERSGTIGKITPDGKCSIFVEMPEGSRGNGICFNSQGYMMIADPGGHNVLKVDMETREISLYNHEPAMRWPNDIAIGFNDIIYATDPDYPTSSGRIYRIDTAGTSKMIEDNMGLVNGIEVGPDEKTLYVAESNERNIWAFDLSPDGNTSNKRLHCEVPDRVDGMRIDVDGNLYVSQKVQIRKRENGSIAKISPKGKILFEVDVVGKGPSNVGFGGLDGRTLYITVADRQNIQTFRVDRPGRSWQLFKKWKLL